MRKLAFAVVIFLIGCSNGSAGPGSLVDAPVGGNRPPGTGGQPATGSATGGAEASGGSKGSVTVGSGGSGGIAGAGGGGMVASGGNAGLDASAGGVAGGGGVAQTGGGTAGAGGQFANPTGGRAGTGGAGDGGGAGTVADGGARDAGAPDRVSDAPAPDVTGAEPDSVRADTRPTGNVTVYVAGDSTVSTYTNSSIHQGGWGQFLQDYFVSGAKIVNKAVGGMTARHFIEAGYLDTIITAIKPGDYLLVQFGTNDGNQTATYTLPGSTTEIPYYLDPQTDFKTYLTKYVDAMRAKNATTIFVTPPPRHSCNAGEVGVRNGLSAYATAMKELGPTLGTSVVDLNAMVVAYLANVTCETSGSTFYLVKADGSIDSTHFQEKGATVMAGLVAKGSAGISTLGVTLAAYVK